MDYYTAYFSKFKNNELVSIEEGECDFYSNPDFWKIKITKAQKKSISPRMEKFKIILIENEELKKREESRVKYKRKSIDWSKKGVAAFKMSSEIVIFKKKIKKILEWKDKNKVEYV